MSANIHQTWASFDEALKAYEQAMLEHRYSQSYIVYHIDVLKGMYNDSIAENRTYSFQKAEIWLRKQKERELSGKIVRHTYNCMRIVILQFDQFYRDGHLVIQRRVEHSKCLPDHFQSIHQEFLHTLPQNLASGTISLHKTNSRQFFEYLIKCSISDLKVVNSETIRNFLADAANRHKRSMEKVLQALKLLFPFLSKKGFDNFDFDFSFIKAGYKRKPILPHFTHEEVKSILMMIDRSTTIGKRDYAIVMVAVYTGLRIADIVGLRLTDIDWRKREIRVQQKKTGSELCLPLNIESGNAVADYILNGRQSSTEEYIFVKSSPPYTKLNGCGVGYYILDRCYGQNEELPEKYKGKTFHSFRRSLASWLSAEQTPLPLLSEILGHANLESSKFYVSHNVTNMLMCCLGFDDIPVLKGELK